MDHVLSQMNLHKMTKKYLTAPFKTIMDNSSKLDFLVISQTQPPKLNIRIFNVKRNVRERVAGVDY